MTFFRDHEKGGFYVPSQNIAIEDKTAMSFMLNPLFRWSVTMDENLRFLIRRFVRERECFFSQGVPFLKIQLTEKKVPLAYAGLPQL